LINSLSPIFKKLILICTVIIWLHFLYSFVLFHFHLDKGLMIKKSDPQKALLHFLKSASIEPNSFSARFQLASLYLESGDPDNSIIQGEMTVKLHPNYPHAWNNLGAAFASKGKLTEAENCFKISESLLFDNYLLHTNIGNLHRLKEEPEKALKKYELSEALGARLRANFLGMSWAYQRLGRPGSAIQSVEYGLKKLPDDEELLLELGRLYMESGDTRKAEHYLTLALWKDPDSKQARKYLHMLFE
jgi:tetratricopeptide (TPR) repeat protein